MESVATEEDKVKEVEKSITGNVLLNLLPSLSHQPVSPGCANKEFVTGKNIVTNPKLKTKDCQKGTSQIVGIKKSSSNGNIELQRIISLNKRSSKIKMDRHKPSEENNLGVNEIDADRVDNMEYETIESDEGEEGRLRNRKFEDLAVAELLEFKNLIDEIYGVGVFEKTLWKSL